MVEPTKIEIKRVYNVNRYDADASLVAAHPFSYQKRRDALKTTRFTHFKPFCKCGWKSTTWHTSKASALDEFKLHADLALLNNPRLTGYRDKPLRSETYLKEHNETNS